MFIYHSGALEGRWLLRLLPLLGFVSALPSSFTEGGGGAPVDASAAAAVAGAGDSSCFVDGFATFFGWISSVCSSGGFPSSVSTFSSIIFLGRPRFLGGCGGISSVAASAFSFEEEADVFFFDFPI